MKRFLAAVVLAAPVLAQVPAHDRRNTETPNTDTHFQMPQYRTLEEWKARRTGLRQQILTASGLDPMPAKTPLHAQVFGRVAHADYSIEKVLIETLPGYWLGGNLYRPVGKSGKLPAIVSPHGHWDYGRLENSERASIPARGIMLARLGFVVLTIDMVGYDDTIQTPHAFGSPREQLWGWGPLGLQLWNSIRAVDFLESLPDVDAARIGATGASGGATQTILLSAVDDRIAFSAPVNMISAIMQGGDFCENAPGLRVGTNNMEIGAMMAPRPMLMVAATGDWTKNTPREEYPAVRSIYRLYGAEDKLEMQQFDAPHNYNQASREAVYRFFAKVVLHRADAATIRERGIHIEKLQDMLALQGRTLPAGALNYDQLVDEWVATARKQSTTPDRARLAAALGTEWPAKVESESAGEHVVLSRAGRGDRVPGTWRPGTLGQGNGAATLVVDAAGAAHAKLPAAGAALAIDAFQTGTAVAPRDRGVKHFLAFNRTDDANRVQDIVTSIAWLRQQGAAAVTLACSGRAAVWCTFAAAVTPAEAKLKLEAPAGAFKGSDEELLRECNVPGIQRAGGWAAAVALARGR